MILKKTYNFITNNAPLDQFIQLDFTCLFDSVELMESFFALGFIGGSFCGLRVLTNYINKKSHIFTDDINSIFSWVFLTNLSGMFYSTATPTGYLTTTLFLSFTIFGLAVILGFGLHGFRFFGILLPAGTPLLFAFFIVPIEFMSFLARSISLGMRLFANLFAGHCLLKIIMSFAWVGLLSPFSISIVFSFILLLGIVTLEIFVAFLQAYVFATLASSYLREAIYMEH